MCLEISKKRKSSKNFSFLAVLQSISLRSSSFFFFSRYFLKMGMTHPTSGKSGYSDYNDYPSSSSQQQGIEKDRLLKMLKHENDLRLSQRYQSKYKLALQEGFFGFVRVTEELQIEVVRTFGYNEREGLKVLEFISLLEFLTSSSLNSLLIRS